MEIKRLSWRTMCLGIVSLIIISATCLYAQAGGGYNVLIDDAHTNIPAHDYFPILQGELEGRGYLVHYASDVGFNPQGYDYLMVVVPTKSDYTSAEIDVVSTFVESGGRLILIGEHGSYTSNARINDLSAGVGTGITFNRDTVYDDTNNDQDRNNWPIIDDFASHSITEGLSEICIYAGCSLDLSGGATALATGGPNSYVVPYIKGKRQTLASPSGEPLTSPPKAIVPGAPIVAAYSTVDNGDVFAIGDVNIFSDDTSSSDIGINFYDNLALALNLFRVGETASYGKTLEDVRLYPNPFIPNDKDSHTGDWTTGIIFDRLTCDTATIEIFTLTGELVRNLEVEERLSLIQWDGTNKNGDKVASGTYLYLITTESGEQRSGKLVVVK